MRGRVTAKKRLITGPHGRRGGVPSPIVRRPKLLEYDIRDLAELKTLLASTTDVLAVFPSQASALLRLAVVNQLKTDAEISSMISAVLPEENLPAELEVELHANLSEINQLANQPRTALPLKSHLKYGRQEIVRLVHDAALEVILEKQADPFPEMTVEDSSESSEMSVEHLDDIEPELVFNPREQSDAPPAPISSDSSSDDEHSANKRSAAQSPRLSEFSFLAPKKNLTESSDEDGSELALFSGYRRYQ